MTSTKDPLYNHRMQRAIKRTLDIFLSSISLILLATPVAIIILVIRLDSRGPVFFRQARVGQDGRRFKIWKLRTMVHDPSRKGPQPLPRLGDVRLTRVGRLLRHTGLDELPQLINVLWGEMALVGPRPALPYQISHHDERQRRRLSVKPGITGWAFIHGRNRLTGEEKIRYDLWYIDHASLWLDLLILFRTPLVLLRGKGVYFEQEEPLHVRPGSIKRDERIRNE